MLLTKDLASRINGIRSVRPEQEKSWTRPLPRHIHSEQRRMAQVAEWRADAAGWKLACNASMVAVADSAGIQFTSNAFAVEEEQHLSGELKSSRLTSAHSSHLWFPTASWTTSTDSYLRLGAEKASIHSAVKRRGPATGTCCGVGSSSTRPR